MNPAILQNVLLFKRLVSLNGWTNLDEKTIAQGKSIYFPL